MASEDEIKAFLSSPLVKWAGSLLPGGEELTWASLARGVTLANILEGLDTNVQVDVNPEPPDMVARGRNMSNLLNAIKTFFKDILGQMILIPLPSPRELALIPPTSTSLEQMGTLLLLLLGAAVQSEQKQEVVITIKNLPLETQHEIVDRIRSITDNPGMVWTSEYSDPTNLGDDQRDEMYGLLLQHTARLVNERDSLNVELAKTKMELDTKGILPPSEGDSSGSGAAVTASDQHALVEVAESKAKLRKLRQQLEEKTEQLAECREELEKLQDVTDKLKTENLELCQDARAAKAYRDELDVVRERADKVDKLEAEILRYKDKMNDIEFFKSRVEELREDNRILVETKEMLEEQLASSRKRCEAVLGLENEIIKYKGDIERLQREREQDRHKMKELLDENSALAFSHKNSLNESQNLLAEMEVIKGAKGSKELNILSEQLGKDAVSRVHRLELENQYLKQELDNTKSQLAKKEKEMVAEIEQETVRTNLMVTKLEEQAQRDGQTIVSAQQEASAVKQELVSLQTTVETLNEQFKLLQIEKETEVESLNKQVEALSARATTSSSQQVASLQEENKKLVQERTVLQTQVSKYQHEKDKSQKSIETLKEKADQLEATQTRLDKIHKENEHLASELEKLSSVQVEYDSVSEQFGATQSKLKELSQRYEELSTDHMKMKVENQKLTRRIESIRNDNHTIADIEQEKDGLKQTVAQLRSTIDTLQKSQTKHDELEIKAMATNNENIKLQRQVDNLNRKLEEMSTENTEIETENKKMQKTIETLKVTARRVNELESENLELEGKAHKVERENKSLNREMERLKQAVEVKDLSLDTYTAKLAHTERELERLRKETEELKVNENKIKDLEAQNADLASQCMADKRALIDLREELVKEKMAAEQLSAKLEQVSGQLQVLEENAKQIGELQSSSGGGSSVLVDRERKVSAASGLAFSDHSGVGEENRISILQAERDQLSSELARLRVAAVGREDKEAALAQQLETLQFEITGERKEKACLQVENRTLQSQSSSLLAQINSLQADYSKLEEDLAKTTAKEKEAREETNQVLEDQTRLQRLHDQLQQDYDRLAAEREELKSNERALRLEISKLREKISGYSQGEDDILRAKEAIDQERETLRMDKKTLANLRSEHSRLKDDFRSLFTANERMKTEYCNLQTDYKGLKSENNQLKLKKTELGGQLSDVREQLTLLDVENTKITNRCEVLHQLNLSLEEDRKSLMSQVSLLLYQYHDLLTQTLDDKEHFHEEEKGYEDKVNNLRRQKEKLEEKIMEQYKKMENPTPKKKGIGLNIVKKMKKAGSTMFLPSPSGRVSAASNPRREGGRHGGISVLGGAGAGIGDGVDGRYSNREDPDSSSIGSGGNDSIESGGRSPSETMMTSERMIQFNTDKLLFRRSLPASMMGIGLEDFEVDRSDLPGDNESLASSILPGYQDSDHIPTRDTGPSRDGNRSLTDYSDFGARDTSGAGHESGLLTPQPGRRSSESQPRSISRVYLSAGSTPDDTPASLRGPPTLIAGGGGSRWGRGGSGAGGGAADEPRLTGWRKTPASDDDTSTAVSLPPLPARRATVNTPPPPPSRSSSSVTGVKIDGLTLDSRQGW